MICSRAFWNEFLEFEIFQPPFNLVLTHPHFETKGSCFIWKFKQLEYWKTRRSDELHTCSGSRFWLSLQGTKSLIQEAGHRCREGTPWRVRGDGRRSWKVSNVRYLPLLLSLLCEDDCSLQRRTFIRLSAACSLPLVSFFAENWDTEEAVVPETSKGKSVLR